jgi:drug/metabolite transporter (DMT)-like permease
VLIGVGVGFAGVAVLARPSGGATSWGIALCVLSAGCGRRARCCRDGCHCRPIRSLATAYEMLSGGLVMLPLGIATMGTFSPSTQSVLGWVYLVTIGSVVGYTAYVWLLANAPLSLVSTYAFMNPVVAITLGVLFQGEQLGVRLLIGAAIVVVAVAIVVTQEPPVATQREEGVR